MSSVSSVSVGLDVPAHLDDGGLDAYRAVVRDAEAAGFDRLWVGDHLRWHRPRHETFTLLALLAGITSLGLGSAVALAPLRAPWWLAKTVATLHCLAPGGVVLGLGAGGEYEAEFAAAGVPLAERGRRLDQAVTHCRWAWSDAADDDVSPRPSSPPAIWLGGRRGAALRRAAEQGDGWIGLFLTPDQVVQRVAWMTERRPAQLAPLTVALAVWVAVDDDSDVAVRAGLDALSREYRMPADRFARHVVAGTPHEVAQRLAAYADAGVEHLDVHLAHPDAHDQLARWQDDVMPRLRG